MTENGCYTLTAQDITAGQVSVTTSHTSVYGEATCQTASRQPLSPGEQAIGVKMPPPKLVCPAVTVDNGNLLIDVSGLNENDRICWLSDDGQ